MGEIVAAFGVCHSPHLLTRPPDEIPEQSEASIGAMRQLGKLLDETKPDVILFLGSDHLDTFSMTCVPTFAIIWAIVCSPSTAVITTTFPTIVRWQRIF